MWGKRSKLCIQCYGIIISREFSTSHIQFRSKPLTSCISIRQFSIHSSLKSENSVSVNSGSSSLPVPKKRNTKILCLDPSEYENYAVGLKRLSLADRQGEPGTIFKSLRLRKEDDEPGKMVNDIAAMQTEIDLHPKVVRRLYDSIVAESDIKEQMYNTKRVTVLGRDLGAAHFIVARKGRIRFMGHSNWISNYKKFDEEDGDYGKDLPALRPSEVALPILYDPNYRVEALDASGIGIRYEGLTNLSGLNYLKWLSLRDSIYIDDWCLDRIFCNHFETLEHLDISGCRGISACGLSGIWRLTQLKTLVVENLPHINNLEILCAHLEDQMPGLFCVGVDYSKKLTDMRQEAADLEQKMKEIAAAQEANTIEIIPIAAESSTNNAKELNSSDYSSSVKN